MKKDAHQLVLVIMYGIHEGKLFIQFANEYDDIVYEVKDGLPNTHVATIIETLHTLLDTEEFKNSEIKLPKVDKFISDGTKIIGKRQYLECKQVEPLCPTFKERLLKYIEANGQY